MPTNESKSDKQNKNIKQDLQKEIVVSTFKHSKELFCQKKQETPNEEPKKARHQKIVNKNFISKEGKQSHHFRKLQRF